MNGECVLGQSSCPSSFHILSWLTKPCTTSSCHLFTFSILLAHSVPPSRVVPQGLCTCCSICLECSSHRCPPGFLLISFESLLKCHQEAALAPFPAFSTRDPPPPPPALACNIFFLKCSQPSYTLPVPHWNVNPSMGRNFCLSSSLPGPQSLEQSSARGRRSTNTRSLKRKEGKVNLSSMQTRDSKGPWRRVPAQPQARGCAPGRRGSDGQVREREEITFVLLNNLHPQIPNTVRGRKCGPSLSHPVPG